MAYRVALGIRPTRDPPIAVTTNALSQMVRFAGPNGLLAVLPVFPAGGLRHSCAAADISRGRKAHPRLDGLRSSLIQRGYCFVSIRFDNASRHTGHGDGHVIAGTPRSQIGHVQHAVGRVQVVVDRATRTDSQKRRDFAAVEIDPGRVAVVASGQQVRTRPWARTPPAGPLQRFADRLGRGSS